MFISTGISLLGAQPSGGGGLWTPADMITTAWYDVSDSSTVTLNGSNVASLDDKSGNGYTAIQTNASDQPLLLTAAVNGLDSMQLGTNSPFRGTAHLQIGAVGPVLTQTKYAVISHHARYNGQNQNMVVAATGSSAGNSNGLLHVGYDGPTKMRLGQFANDLDDTGIPNNYDVDVMMTALNRAGGKLISLNGGQYSTSNTNTTDIVAGGNTGFSIGRFGGNAYEFAGRINEIVILAYDVSDTLYQKIEGYMAWKWGTEASLPVTHPYYSAAPTT